MLSQIFITFIGQTIPGVLGIISSVTAEELIDLTNQVRLENGLSALELNSDLTQAATQKAADMIAKNYWAHTSPDGQTPWYFFKDAGYQYLYAGENLARDFLDSGSVIEAWLSSPTHKDNLLSNRYQDIGIAVIHDTFQGQETVLVVQLFGTQASATLPARLGQISGAAEVAEAGISQLELEHLPLISSFHLTKATSISLIIVLLAIIIIDAIIISRQKIVRLSGWGWLHLAFLGTLLLILIFMHQGIIL